MNNLNKGQKLWFVPSQRGYSQREVEIVKVGRVYAEIDNNRRIFISDLTVDGRGYSSPGTCYLSREEYEKESALQEAWFLLRDEIGARYNAKNCTINDILKAAELLSLDINKYKNK